MKVLIPATRAPSGAMRSVQPRSIPMSRPAAKAVPTQGSCSYQFIWRAAGADPSRDRRTTHRGSSLVIVRSAPQAGQCGGAVSLIATCLRWMQPMYRCGLWPRPCRPFHGSFDEGKRGVRKDREERTYITPSGGSLDSPPRFHGRLGRFLQLLAAVGRDRWKVRFPVVGLVDAFERPADQVAIRISRCQLGCHWQGGRQPQSPIQREAEPRKRRDLQK